MLFFEDIIKLLEKDGVNSKKKAIDVLKNLTYNNLIEIRREITEEINIRNKKNQKIKNKKENKL